MCPKIEAVADLRKAHYLKKIAARLGRSRRTLRRAQQHVETAERFPWMQGHEWCQSHVLAVHDALRKIPATHHGHAADLLHSAAIMGPAYTVKVIRALPYEFIESEDTPPK